MVRSTAKEGEKHPQRPKIGPFLGPPAGSAPSALLGGPPGPPYRPLLNWTLLVFAPRESGPPQNGPPGGPPGGRPPSLQYCLSGAAPQGGPRGGGSRRAVLSVGRAATRGPPGGYPPGRGPRTPPEAPWAPHRPPRGPPPRAPPRPPPRPDRGCGGTGHGAGGRGGRPKRAVGALPAGGPYKGPFLGLCGCFYPSFAVDRTMSLLVFVS
jgi:hypothetical protein